MVDFGRLKLLKDSTAIRASQDDPFLKCNQDGMSQTVLNDEQGSECEETYMTPCSTPPVSENSLSSSRTQIKSMQCQNIKLKHNFLERIYDTYVIDFTDMQIVIIKNKKSLEAAMSKSSSRFYLLDRFDISLQIERRILNTKDPDYPSLTAYGILPKLLAHINEHKIISVLRVLKTNNLNIPKLSNHFISKSIPLDEKSEKLLEQSKEYSSVLVQFVVHQICLELQSHGKSMIDFQITGTHAAFSLEYGKIDIKISVYGLLFVDAFQSYGPDFEVLVTSHKYTRLVLNKRKKLIEVRFCTLCFRTDCFSGLTASKLSIFFPPQGELSLPVKATKAMDRGI